MLKYQDEWAFVSPYDGLGQSFYPENGSIMVFRNISKIFARIHGFISLKIVVFIVTTVRNKISQQKGY
jgi:hypothetical protein